MPEEDEKDSSNKQTTSSIENRMNKLKRKIAKNNTGLIETPLEKLGAEEEQATTSAAKIADANNEKVEDSDGPEMGMELSGDEEYDTE